MFEIEEIRGMWRKAESSLTEMSSFEKLGRGMMMPFSLMSMTGEGQGENPNTRCDWGIVIRVACNQF